MLLEDRRQRIGDNETGKAVGCFGGRQALYRQVVLGGACQDPGEHGTVCRAHLQDPGLVVQRLGAAFLQLGPQLEGTLQQRHVVGVLGVGLSDDVGLSV